MVSTHQQYEESSSDEKNLAALKAVAVSFEDLTRKSGQDSSKVCISTKDWMLSHTHRHLHIQERHQAFAVVT